MHTVSYVWVPAGQHEDDEDVVWNYHRLWVPSGQDKYDQDVQKTLTNMKANQKPKKTCFLAGYKENQRQTTKNQFCSMQFNKLEKSFWGFSSYDDSLHTCRSLHQLAHSSWLLDAWTEQILEYVNNITQDHT